MSEHASERTSERSGARKRSKQGGASKRVSGTSERANRQASGLVLTSRFLFVPDHSATAASSWTAATSGNNNNHNDDDDLAKSNAYLRENLSRFFGAEGRLSGGVAEVAERTTSGVAEVADRNTSTSAAIPVGVVEGPACRPAATSVSEGSVAPNSAVVEMLRTLEKAERLGAERHPCEVARGLVDVPALASLIDTLLKQLQDWKRSRRTIIPDHT